MVFLVIFGIVCIFLFIIIVYKCIDDTQHKCHNCGYHYWPGEKHDAPFYDAGLCPRCQCKLDDQHNRRSNK